MELTMNKTLLLLLLTFQLSYAQGVNNSTTLNLKDGVTVTVRGNYTHEANAVVNLDAGTTLSIEGSMTDNGGSFNGDGEVYLNDVDVYGCTDSLALNYDENATIDDGSCSGYPDNGEFHLSFDGEDDWVYIGTPIGMNPTGNHTFMFWIQNNKPSRVKEKL